MIRIFRHYIPKWLLILGTTEALILFGSIYLGVAFPLLDDFNPTDKLVVGGVWGKGLGYASLMMLLLACVGLYQRGLRDDLRGLMLRIGVAFCAGLVPMVLVLSLLPHLSIGSQGFALAFVTSVTGVVLFRTIMYRYSDLSVFKRRVLVLGTGELACEVDRLRRRSDWQDMVLVGFVPMEGEEIEVRESMVLVRKTTLRKLALEHRVDVIVVAVKERGTHFPVNQILDCKMSGIEVLELLTFYERATGKLNLEALNPGAMIFADGFIQAVIKSYVHRGFDLVVSLGMLLVVWPILLATAGAIWLESRGGPVLYRQIRVGRNNRPFEILKFRSMRVDAERGGAQWATIADERVTTVGDFLRKTHLDELPQLINVLKGEMSFVGPRPERHEFVEELTKKIGFYSLRHRVNPGITGWAQICYPYGASTKDAREKLQYDLYYIKNYSLFLDVMILIQTAQVILWGKGR